MKNQKLTSALLIASSLLLAASCGKGKTGGDEPSPCPSGAVDLGLSVYWATCNLGASKPEEPGGYYQWAGTEDVTSTSIYLDWNICPYHTGSDYKTGWTKYIPLNGASYWSGPGSPDNKAVLDAIDDAAHAKLGGKWRIPTDAEWTELMDNCTWTWTDNYNGTGVKGRIITGRKPGHTDKSIFLPAAEYRGHDYLSNDGLCGDYWSSSLDSGCLLYGRLVFFYSDSVYRDCSDRYYGLSIRPVSD